MLLEVLSATLGSKAVKLRSILEALIVRQVMELASVSHVLIGPKPMCYMLKVLLPVVTANSSADSMSSGQDTLFYRTSPQYTIADDDLAHFNESVSALQLLLIRPEYDSSQGPRGQSDGPKLFCRIVDKQVVDATAEQNGQVPSFVSSTTLMAWLASFAVLASML